MLTRRTLMIAAGVFAASPFILAGQQAAQAAPGQPFTTAAFEEAQKAGKSILLIVHAPWCPTCRVQEPIIRKLLAEPKYGAVVAFSIDFDSQKDVLRRLRATNQSTLIGFKGMTETRRSSGDTEAMTIEDLIETTL